jgi:hypothetical protein
MLYGRLVENRERSFDGSGNSMDVRGSDFNNTDFLDKLDVMALSDRDDKDVAVLGRGSSDYEPSAGFLIIL